MVPLASLWLPVLLSAIVVFLASWMVHMLLPHHRVDYLKLPQEDAVLDALRALDIPSGQYLAPFVTTAAQMKEPAYVEKRKRGAIFLTLMAGPDPGMGKPLLQWFIYLLVISLTVAFLAGEVIGAGAPYPAVFKFVCVAALLAYVLGHPHQSIWFRQSWRATCNYAVDGLIYSLLTAGVFGWLWPR